MPPNTPSGEVTRLRAALAGLAVVVALAACTAAGDLAPPAPRSAFTHPPLPAAPVTPRDEARGDKGGDAVGGGALRDELDVARVAAARPKPQDPPPPAPAAPVAFAIDLFRDGDFVPQYTFEWCVAASIQMAFNMVRDDLRTSREDQQQLWELARDRSSNPYRGADPGGWATVLNEVGIGHYELVSIPDYHEALRVAAAALRDTNRPVGLVMWRGRHAWVMSGFESLGDPAVDADFRLTGIRVLDPLYPHGSSIWGPSPAPNTLMSPDELAKQFVFREKKRWSSHIDAGHLLVLPVSAPTAAGRGVLLPAVGVARAYPLHSVALP